MSGIKEIKEIATYKIRLKPLLVAIMRCIDYCCYICAYCGKFYVMHFIWVSDDIQYQISLPYASAKITSIAYINEI